MHHTAKNIVFGRAFMHTVMGYMGTGLAVDLIDGGFVRLSQDPDFALGANTLIADLTAGEADYSGYVAGGIAFVPSAGVNVSSNVVGIQTPVTFAATVVDPFVQNTVYGWWLDDGTNFVAGERFVLPLVYEFLLPLDYLQLDVVLPFGLVVATGL